MDTSCAALAHFLLTHVPPLRDEAGHHLVFNRHVKLMQNEAGESVFQYRRIGAGPTKTSTTSKRSKASVPARHTHLLVHNLPSWLGGMLRDYMDKEWGILFSDAVRKSSVEQAWGSTFTNKPSDPEMVSARRTASC